MAPEKFNDGAEVDPAGTVTSEFKLITPSIPEPESAPAVRSISPPLLLPAVASPALIATVPPAPEVAPPLPG